MRSYVATRIVSGVLHAPVAWCFAGIQLLVPPGPPGVWKGETHAQCALYSGKLFMASGAWKYTMHVTVHLPPPLVIHSPQPTHCRACCYMQDLIQNHLTMALYNHAAIWAGRPDRMPRAFYTNGHLCIARMVEGKVGDWGCVGCGPVLLFCIPRKPCPSRPLSSLRSTKWRRCRNPRATSSC